MSKEDSLRTLLNELNQRTRMYSNQFWQVPFAYLGVIGIMLGLSYKTGVPNDSTLRLGSSALLVIGILIIWMMIGIFRALDKNVGHLIDTEKELGLNSTAKKHHLWIDIPNFLIVITGMTVCLLIAFNINIDLILCK